VLSARPEAVSKARHTVSALPIGAAARHKLEVLVSELVANAIRHAKLTEQDPVSVHITAGNDRVRMAVRDQGPGFDTASVGSGDPLEPGGQGLVIVDALAESWGVEADLTGCTVWCEIAVDEHPREWVDRAVTDAYVGDLGRAMAAS
jgi:anti-sigma regulatory factor (Ser/Thr protein kinase)